MDDAAGADLTRALGHQLRLGFLRAFGERAELSPVEYSRECGQPISNISYHVKALWEAGILEEGEQIARRGAVEHRYKLTGRRAGQARAVLDLLQKL